jgi:triphosphatase
MAYGAACARREQAVSDEVELKFDVDPACVERLRAAPALAAAARSEQSESVYFDTPDQALRRAGVSLRVRRSGGRIVQTVKRKTGDAAGLFVREEWEAELKRFGLDPGAFADPEARRLLARFDRSALAPVIRTSFTRTAWEVAHAGSRIEVVLDEGAVRAGRRSAPLTELELELIEGKPAALFALAGQVGQAAPLFLGSRSKSERGYALLEGSLGRPAKADPILLGAGESVADAFRKIALACLRHYRLNEMALLAGRDPDALHQARVALRRLRSALTLFRPAAKGAAYERIRDELRWYAGRFGDARNLDVLLAGTLLPDDASLRRTVEAERERAYDHVLATLRSDRGRALMLCLASWIALGGWAREHRASGEVRDLAARGLDRQWRKVCRRGAEFATLDPDALHRLRIDVKKLRYAAEFLASLYAEKTQAGRARRFAAALRDLQERLGDANDARIAQDLVARLAPGREGEIAIPDVARGPAEAAYGRAAKSAGYWLPAG